MIDILYAPYISINYVMILILILGGSNLIIPIIIKNYYRKLIAMLAVSIVYIVNAVLIYKFYDLNNYNVQINILQFYNLRLGFAYNHMGACLLILISTLWPISIMYSIGYLKSNHEANSSRFLFFYNLCILLSSIICFASNMFTMIVIYELLTLSTIFLVRHHNSERTEKALYHYLRALLVPSLLFLIPAFVLIQSYYHTTDFTIIKTIHLPSPNIYLLLSLLVLFGTAKAAIVPFHSWLPAAMIAPYPVSALLHAVAVVNVGIFCLLTVVISIFYLNPDKEVLYILQYITAFSVIYSSIKALTQDTIKKMLAYSTISNLSLIVLTAFIGTKEALDASITHMVAHSLGKITLFFASGCIYTAAKYTSINDYISVGYKFPIITLCFTIASLSLIGIPPFAGFLSKYSIIISAAQDNNNIIIFTTIITSLLSCCYLSKPIKLAYIKSNTIKDCKILEVDMSKYMIYSTILCTILIILYSFKI